MKFFKIFIPLFIMAFGVNLEGYASSPKKENPIFWTQKIKNPFHLLLTSSDIQRMNEANLQKPELLLCNIKEMKEVWTREEIVAFLHDDWKSFGKSDQARYGKWGRPLDDSFWIALKENIYSDGLKETFTLLFGLTVQRTDIRVFPTEEPSMSSPAHHDFDLFQHSAIAPASTVGIYHFSRDRLWAYAQTSFIRGWIRTKDLAIAKDRSDVFGRDQGKEPLVVTGNFVTVFADPLCERPLFSAQMGSSFRLLRLPDKTKAKNSYYTISIPLREADGRLSLGDGYIPATADVHIGFLPYTQNNIARQAFKMLHQPYGWGEMSGGRDCSRFIMDVFNTFGILMPRNSNLQAKMGISLGSLEGKTTEEKKKILDRAIPMATLLRMPGHIMLYLGKHDGKCYVLHSIRGIQTKGKLGPEYKKIGKVTVTDLDFGKESPNGSLFERLTSIRFLGFPPPQID